MISRLSTIFFFVFCMCFVSSVKGQTIQDEMIKGNFQKLPFNRFIDEIKQQSSYLIYYDPALLDSLTVTINADSLSLPDMLDSIFTDTDYHYAVYGKRIFITRNRTIYTEKTAESQDFSPQNQTEIYDVGAYDYMSDQKETTDKIPKQEIYEIGIKTRELKQGQASISGVVRNINTGEAIIGAVVYNEKTARGVVSDLLGSYSIILPKGMNTLIVRCLGMQERKLQVMLYSEGRLDIELKESIIPLKEVVVESQKNKNVYRMQTGHELLEIKTVKQLPLAIGEADIMKAVLTLPGVMSAGESSTDLNVRGGSASQNLILFNDATVYNSSHFFGFFSAFNPDIVKNIELYKSGTPAKFGGRVSSVMDITSKEGNKKKISGSGGIGPVTGRLTLEGPVVKEKMSVLVSGRSTYSDWILSLLPDEALNKSKGSFYDLHTYASFEKDNKNHIYFSGYYSNDRFRLNGDTLYRYNNINSSIQWKHIFKNKLYGIFSSSFSNYGYNIISRENPVNASQLKYRINQTTLGGNLSYIYNNQHSLSFGASMLVYNLSPTSAYPVGSKSEYSPFIVQNEQAIENAIYFADQYDITSRLSLYLGLRFSLYSYLGPRDMVSYVEGLPISEETAITTKHYNALSFIQNYGGPEFRFSTRYLLTESLSVKAGYQRMRQYIHMLSNTTVISPTDIWKLSDPSIKPEISDQVSIGLYKDLKSGAIEISAESYYKFTQNFPDYKDGAILVLNPNIERDIIEAVGTAYGIEFMIRKMSGKLNGWLSYTYARSLLHTRTKSGPESIRDGELYPGSMDKPHDITFISNYKFSKRFSVSYDITYSTGRPITLPLAKYELAGGGKLLYSERNQFRIPDYFRMDFSMNIEGNHKIKKLAHGSWSISVYNLTGRKNAYSVFFRSENGSVNGYKLSVFGMAVPSVTYNFRF